MCSVVGCDSWRRSVHRFKLPEDPERRLEWVQFLIEVNGQRLIESSWTDITICCEHFTGDCFISPTPETDRVRLKPGAVPSLCTRFGTEEPPDSTHEKPHVSPHTDGSKPSLSSNSRESTPVLTGSQPSSESRLINDDLNKENAALLQMKGTFVVSENGLLQLFRHRCPTCGGKLQTEKVTYGLLVVLNQQCLQCEHRSQWKSQVNASIATPEDLRPTEVTPDPKQKMPADAEHDSGIFSEIITFSDEEGVPSDEPEEADESGRSSDGEWNPSKGLLLDEELTKQFEEGSEDENDEEEGEDFDSLGGLKINELCTECGSFFNIRKTHKCEHKVKPFSCNICGRRCVSEGSLKIHSRIHAETYEHPCKYCHVRFKARVDKLKHEQTHKDKIDSFKCPDCTKTFATCEKRKLHLAAHRVPQEFKCGICEIMFKDVHHLRRHSVVHTGLKPYKCSVCQRGFNQASHLKSHMRLHTGERPFTCEHCDKSFNHNVSLKSHVQRCHTSSSGQGQCCVESDAQDAEDRGKKRCADTEEEEAQEEEEDTPKKRRRTTGRPRGRPKRSTEGDLIVTGGGKNTKTAKKRLRSDKESEGEQVESNFDSKEEVEPETTTIKSRGNDSDTDFYPAEEIKMKTRSSGKSSEKCRGRTKNNAAK